MMSSRMRSVHAWALPCVLLALTTGSSFAGEMYGVVPQRRLLTDAAVRSELALTAEQTDSLDRLLASFAEASSKATAQKETLPRDASEEDVRKRLDAELAVSLPLSEQFEHQLRTRLRPGQIARLRELCVQYRSDVDLCRFLATSTQLQADLKISKEQLGRLGMQLAKQIRERGAASGRKWKQEAEDILTPKQREKLAQLKGDPFVPQRYMAEQGKKFDRVTLPIRVHLLTSDSVEELQCSFTDEQIREQLMGVNAIWAQAGIVWEIESIVREPVGSSDGYRELLASSANRDGAMRARQNRQRVLGSLIQEKNRLDSGFNVYIVEDLGSIGGGVFMPRRQAVLYARFGPKGEQRPTVLAHELGHALSLPHVVGKGPQNLMATGGKYRVQMLSTYLNSKQVAAARRQAQTGQPVNAEQIEGARRPTQTGRPANLAEIIDRLFKLNDANGDGQISLEEARPVVKSSFQTFDADGDGVVDRSEFDRHAAKSFRRPSRPGNARE